MRTDTDLCGHAAPAIHMCYGEGDRAMEACDAPRTVRLPTSRTRVTMLMVIYVQPASKH